MARQSIPRSLGARQLLRSRAAWVAAALLAWAAAVGCNTGPPPPPPAGPAEVDVAAAISGMVTDHEDFTGRMEAVQTADLRARVTGYLTSAPFEQGAEVKGPTRDEKGKIVKEGDLLFKIDPRPYLAVLAQAEATVNQAEAHRQSAEDVVRRDRASPTATPQAQMVQDEGALAEATAAVRSARATRDAAALNVTFTDVAAPFDGRISRRALDPGALVQADIASLATLVQLDPIYAFFDVDERTLLRVRRLIGQNKISRTSSGVVSLPVYLGLSDELGFKDEKGRYRHPGTVKFVNNQEDALTGTLREWGEFPNADKMLSPGMFARIELPIGPAHPAVLISEEALVTDQGRKLLYVVEDGKNDKGEPLKTAVAREVRIGSLVGGLRVIEDNLKPGDLVVVNGLQRVRDKKPVAVKNEVKLQPPPADDS